MKTLLNGVNEVLKKLRLIDGDNGTLTSLTDSGIQNWIDQSVQAWNETIDDLYSRSGDPKPNELAENTITLVTGDRDYALQTDINQLHFPFHDETNGNHISEYPGGYLALTQPQLYPSNENGLAFYGVIRPTDGELYLDKIPTASENGRVYKYRYDKELVLTLAADTVPFSDVVFRALVAPVSEIVNRTQGKDFDSGLYSKGIGRAANYLNQTQQHDSYISFSRKLNTTDPFDA